MVITKGDVANAGSFLALPKRHRTIGFVRLGVQIGALYLTRPWIVRTFPSWQGALRGSSTW